MYDLLRPDVPLREVVDYFLACDEKLKEQADQWKALDDESFFNAVRSHFDKQHGASPALVWTVGIKGNEHYRRVRRWDLCEVPIDGLYSRGVNDTVNVELDKVAGNIKAFAQVVADKFKEFQPRDVAQERRKIMAVAHSNEGRDGSVELIDGIHRLVSMILNGQLAVLAYLAELGDSDRRRRLPML